MNLYLLLVLGHLAHPVRPRVLKDQLVLVHPKIRLDPVIRADQEFLEYLLLLGLLVLLQIQDFLVIRLDLDHL